MSDRQLRKQFRDGSLLEHDNGKFDQWCVYLTPQDKARYAPTDAQCFEKLLQYARQYGNRRLYGDFVTVYEATGTADASLVFRKIEAIAASYPFADQLEIEILFSILYMAMIAENNKRFTKLGKRIKHLGVYQLLMEGMGIREAAQFSRDKTAKELADLCHQRGF